ncbi:MAG: fibronectin type III domain-containing protein [Promethearchaeota archaeon]
MKTRGALFLVTSILMVGLATSPFFTAQTPLKIKATPLALGDPWSVLWMHPNYYYGFTAIATTASAVFIAGTICNAGPAMIDIFDNNIILLKYTNEGELLWNKSWATSHDNSAPSYDEVPYALALSVDALYLAGETTTGPYGTNGLLIKLDFEGNQLWNISFGNFYTEEFTCIGIGSDGVYVGGILWRTGTDGDALIAKFDFNGNELWSEVWDMAAVDQAYGVAVGSDGVYLVGDFGPTLDGTSNNAFLAKYSFTGVQMWNSTWGGLQKDLARAVTVNDTSVYVTGSTNSFSPISSGALFLRKYNSTNSLLWEVIDTTGLDHEGIGLSASEDTTYVGSKYGDPAAGYQVNLLNFNATGELNWKRAWGGAGNCQPYGYAPSDDGYYFAGSTRGWLTPLTNGFFVKYGADGEVSPGPVELFEPTFLNPYGSLILSWTQAFDPNSTIDGYELQMDSTPFFNIPDRTWNVNTTNLVLSNHPPGTYYFRLRARDHTPLFGPWSNLIEVTISLVPPALFNPWLAPLVLVLGILVVVAITLWIFIRQRRFQ